MGFEVPAAMGAQMACPNQIVWSIAGDGGFQMTMCELATIAQDKRCILYVWYDNEFGYSCQVLRVVRDMAGLSFPTLPL